MHKQGQTSWLLKLAGCCLKYFLLIALALGVGSLVALVFDYSILAERMVSILNHWFSRGGAVVVIFMVTVMIFESIRH